MVAVGAPHHVTQRGNNRQKIFFSDSDRHIYLAFLAERSRKFGMTLLGYCLMPNHVHLVAVPARADSLARALGRAHYDYAVYFNHRKLHSGHVWQNRFYSAPLDRAHLGTALRYVDLNPVRARLAQTAVDYRWSSARAHSTVATRAGCSTWRPGRKSVRAAIGPRPWRGAIRTEKWGQPRSIALTFGRLAPAD